MLSRREPAFLLGGKNHEKVLQIFFIRFRQRLRGRCSEPSRNIFVRALAFVTCFSVCVSGLILAPDLGGFGSVPQVVYATDVHWGGGSSGGGGASTNDGSKYDDGPLWAALTSLQQQINVQANGLRLVNDEYLKSLQTQINANASSINSIWNDGMRSLQVQISNEYSARDSGDKSLQAQIHDEASARDGGDKSLQAQIHDEASMRDGVDKSLQAQIHGEASTRDGADKSLQAQIHDEASVRDGSDKSLQNQIHDEAAARDSDDKSLQSQITATNGLVAAVSSVADTNKKQINIFSDSVAGLQKGVGKAQAGVDANAVQINKFFNLASGLQQSIDSLSSPVDLSIVTHAIDVVRDSVNSVNDTALKIFNFLHDDFWPMFRDLHTLIDSSVMQILDKVTGIDNKFAGFWSDFKDFRDVTSGFYLNFGKVMADFQKGVFSGLLAVSEWLKAIYYSIQNLPAPETSEVHLPTNDGGGGGSGTNIWDVLKQLIESLGTIVGKLVDALSKLADLVSQLFVPKDLSFISDTFDGISSKFDKKFAIFIDFSSSLKGLFSSRHALKDFSLSFAGASVVVPLSTVSVLAGTMRPLLTGLFVLLTVIGVYRRFTDGEVVS